MSSHTDATDRPSFFRQPKAVWATAFAAMVGFMGIGLVDPILTSIARGLSATPGQVSLLFTSYFAVTAVMMLITGAVSSRLGGRTTLLLGTLLIAAFAALAGTSETVAQLVAFRGGWGLGNALFVATALSVIVASANGGPVFAILLYEAALGLGISVGPLLGAALGHYSWRYPFFGTAALMVIGFLAIALFLGKTPKPARKTSPVEPLLALGHKGLSTAAVSAFFYNYAFFTVLAFVPFVLDMTPHAVGTIYFGWGIALAAFSVLVAPRLQSRFAGTSIIAWGLGGIALLLVAMAFGIPELTIAAVVISGAVMGINNTVYTEIALEVSGAPRPIASAAYNFVRWFAGVIAPYAAPEISERFGAAATFAVAAAAAAIGAAVMLARKRHLGHFAFAPSARDLAMLGLAPAQTAAETAPDGAAEEA